MTGEALEQKVVDLLSQVENVAPSVWQAHLAEVPVAIMRDCVWAAVYLAAALVLQWGVWRALPRFAEKERARGDAIAEPQAVMSFLACAVTLVFTFMVVDNLVLAAGAYMNPEYRAMLLLAATFGAN